MERPELGQDERFSTRDQRVKHVNELDALVAEWMRANTCAELLTALDGTGTPAAQVRDP